MNETIIKRLNDLNRDFYRTTAQSFDETRQHAWPGWEKLLPYLPMSPLSVLKVLDVGCGNGRFGVYLSEKFEIHYHGIDNNTALLAHARESLPNARLEEQDIVENPPTSGEYDLVALFGVMHHIPGEMQRRDLIRTLAERVAPGGLLVFACWRFYEYERFRSRIVAWPDDLRREVEPGDYLLDWRRGDSALRYCHYVDDVEQGRLTAASGLNEIATYRADGNTNDINCYTVLKKTG